jgi:hypothetical protein
MAEESKKNIRDWAIEEALALEEGPTKFGADTKMGIQPLKSLVTSVPTWRETVGL